MIVLTDGLAIAFISNKKGNAIIWSNAMKESIAIFYTGADYAVCVLR